MVYWKNIFFVFVKKLFSFHYIFTKAASQRRQERKFSYLTIWKVKKRDMNDVHVCYHFLLVTRIPAFLPSSLLIIITLPPWITLGSICLGRWGLQHQHEQINISLIWFSAQLNNSYYSLLRNLIPVNSTLTKQCDCSSNAAVITWIH